MDQPSAADLSSLDTMARLNHHRSDPLTPDERIDYSRQGNMPGQESVPLCDILTNGGTLDRPLGTGRRIPEGEGRWDQNDREPMLESTNTKPKLMENGAAGELQKHVLGLWLIVLYGFVAILSWGITCVLCYQPIGVPTYFDQVGNYSRSQYERSEGWRKAADVGNAIIAAIGITVTSAICARAAAVYCQKSSDAKVPGLTLRQMLVLADKGWNDSAVLWDVLRPNTSRKTRSPLLILSAVLVGVGE